MLRRFFLKEVPDVLGLLRKQAEMTLAGMEEFARWSAGGGEKTARAVRDAEHNADASRIELLHALSSALTTPVDQEDVFTLSERLDAVINEAKNAVRESEALGIPPDEHTARMGSLSLEATQSLVAGLNALGKRSERPGEHADAAVKAARRIDRAYRDAIAELPDGVDARTQIQTIELYRSYTQIAEAVDNAATRTWYALLKAE